MRLTLLTAVLTPLAMLVLGGLMTEIGDWYRDLKKPLWNPPNWLFAPAWTIILGLAGWAGFLAWTAAGSDMARYRLILLFAAIIVLHLLWSPLFFKLRRPDLALLEIPCLWLSILTAMIDVAGMSVLSAWLLLPYLAWVTFATALNLAIVRLNGPFKVKARR